MSTFGEVFRNWTDFPKGLRVLLLDRDIEFLQEIRYKLERLEFYVASFYSVEEACKTLGNNTQSFHIALVEARENDDLNHQRILSFAKDLPIVMMSTAENIQLMVKVITLGAVEFLVKPLLEDKLRNIWQHVVRKVLDSPKEALQSGYLEPGNPTISVKEEDDKSFVKREVDNQRVLYKEEGYQYPKEACYSCRLLITSEGLSEPSTPQVEQAGKKVLPKSIIDESQRSNDSTEFCDYKEISNQPIAAVPCSIKYFDSKDVENVSPSVPTLTIRVPKNDELTCNNQHKKSECTVLMPQPETTNTAQMTECKAEDLQESTTCDQPIRKALHYDTKEILEACEFSCSVDYEPTEDKNVSITKLLIPTDKDQCPNADSTCESETFEQNQDKGEEGDESKSTHEKGGKKTKSLNKKPKIDWTADLHRRFVEVVEYFGVEQAIPSRILEMMKVEGLTRHHVASHLQKYRSHKKHLQTREEAGRMKSAKLWSSCIRQTGPQMSIQPHPQCMGSPTLHVWGHPRIDSPSATLHFMPQYCIGAPMPAWPVLMDPTMHNPPLMDSFVPGIPLIASYYGSCPGLIGPFGKSDHSEGSTCNRTWRSFLEDVENANLENRSTHKSDNQEQYPPRDLLDAAISEALRNPLTPPPLGLKPPSMESVMAELQRQGMKTFTS
ncbi:hypothetical protein KP509_01G106700 [Ceratopteris richardii]|uniref:Two-component response regulator-like APRR2 n=1 Tax=Ceratopteris richardii TaxID=49495 RepID=A0A8T2VJJ4_CERRI|nr:hypothetical protein KP509_01G106700 [Ceratopteris richardii]KAH7447422.1 hypothetical protein KP509_01G106700 [Ceratopteris richardii]KAH7447423.1 hypothetical protein KP509_01G106700 [Ceratopteris richardii]KAH7447424.1 hypothetical protein KP509_01G106700 [Ceratopteris richardii]